MTPRLVLLASLAGAAACARHAKIGPDPVREGRGTYLRACAPCHGKNAGGHGRDARTAPDLTHLASRAGGTFPHDYVVDVVTGKHDVPGHAREMPVWRERFGPGNSPAEAAAAVYRRQQLEYLTSYLASIQR